MTAVEASGAYPPISPLVIALVGGGFALAGTLLGLLGQYTLRRLGSIESFTREWKMYYEFREEPFSAPFRTGTADTTGQSAEGVGYELRVELFNHKELAVGFTDLRVCFLERGGSEILVEQNHSEERTVTYSDGSSVTHYALFSTNLPSRQWLKLELSGTIAGEGIRSLHRCDRVELRGRLPGRWRLPGFREIKHQLARLER